MFKKEERAESRAAGAGATTVIASGTRFNGVLRVNGGLRIDGEIEGQVNVSQELTVGPGGVLKAEVTVDSAVVAGRIQGQIQARGKVVLQRGSRLEGDVHAKVFQIEDGAFFQGNCTMGEAPPAAAGPGRAASHPHSSADQGAAS